LELLEFRRSFHVSVLKFIRMASEAQHLKIFRAVILLLPVLVMDVKKSLVELPGQI